MFKACSDLSWILGRAASELAGEMVGHENNPSLAATRRFIATAINPTDRVLDLGCSDGHMTRFVAPLCTHAVGVDHNPRLIADAISKGRPPNVEFLCGDAVEYLRSAGVFNVLICSHIIEHLDDPDSLLSALRDHVQKVYIEVPDNDSSVVNHTRQQMGVAPIYNDVDHIWEFTRASAGRMIELAGYRILEAEFSFGVMRLWVVPA